MEPDQSIGSGPNADEAAGASTVAASKTLTPRAKRSTGGGSKSSKKSKGKKSERAELPIADVLLIFQSSVGMLAKALPGTQIQVATGTSEVLMIRLPKGLRLCNAPGCFTIFQQADDSLNLYCDQHRAGHSTGLDLAVSHQPLTADMIRDVQAKVPQVGNPNAQHP